MKTDGIILFVDVMPSSRANYEERHARRRTEYGNRQSCAGAGESG